MPLRINLKKGQKIIINGAVLENSNSKSVSFHLMNHASVLRENEILTYEEAQTPASRVYFCIQGLYLFKDKREEALTNFNTLLSDYEKAAPSCEEIAADIRSHVTNKEYYQALKSARDLINHEHKVLNNE